MDWTREHRLAVFHLYTLLPFGRLSQGTPEVKMLASHLGRTPSSVAMKLVNFASLDPQVRASGRKGLSGASQEDRRFWEELQGSWDNVAIQAAGAYQRAFGSGVEPADAPLLIETDSSANFTGEEALVSRNVRLGQARFRRAVLTAYGNRCCISGLSESRLLVASHIVPWSQDKGNRLNPANGLCLSALHDRAFDSGLLTILPDHTVRVSDMVLQRASTAPLLGLLAGCNETKISLPERFLPTAGFLEWHARRFGFM